MRLASLSLPHLRITFHLAVAEAQPVRVEVFDLLGRRRALLLASSVVPVSDAAFTIEALLARTYVLRMSAPDGVVTRTFTVF
ncbi:MAG: hypothetical protein AAGF99_18695 [Bacteroidota bacterium]